MTTWPPTGPGSAGSAGAAGAGRSAGAPALRPRPRSRFHPVRPVVSLELAGWGEADVDTPSLADSRAPSHDEGSVSTPRKGHDRALQREGGAELSPGSESVRGGTPPQEQARGGERPLEPARGDEPVPMLAPMPAPLMGPSTEPPPGATPQHSRPEQWVPEPLLEPSLHHGRPRPVLEHGRPEPVPGRLREPSPEPSPDAMPEHERLEPLRLEPVPGPGALRPRPARNGAPAVPGGSEAPWVTGAGAAGEREVTVEVSIGRIEVRMAPEAPAARGGRSGTSPATRPGLVTLEEYGARRGGPR